MSKKSKNKQNKKVINFPFSNEVKQAKEEFKKIGTTGKNSKNYDASIVYFSEFDVVKKIDKDFSIEVGQ